MEFSLIRIFDEERNVRLVCVFGVNFCKVR